MSTSYEYPNPDILVETAWLADNYSNPTVRIIDGRSKEKYIEGHISGAINLDSSVIPSDLESTNDSEFAELLSSQGIGNQHIIVCYDDMGPPAARLWWILSYYGAVNVRMLNGGITKWLSEGRDVTIAKPDLAKTAFIPSIVAGLHCSLDHAKYELDNVNAVFWDTRSEEEFKGELPRGNSPDRLGHIPGAVHLEWNTMIETGTQVIKSANEIRTILESHGITPDKEIVPY